MMMLEQQSWIKKKKKKSVFVATESINSTTRQPVDFVCSQFPTSTNDTIGVTCGAMNPFSNDVPYNSAGISSTYSIDTIPGAFLFPNTKRRKQPPLLPSTNSNSLPPPILTSNNTTTLTNNSNSNSHKHIIQRRLTTSNISIPKRIRRRSSFRSTSPGVECFNYAKALLRSDHELEKLSRKIRAEINESELFELAKAAEKAAESGVDNFSGRASTFGDELKQQQQQQDFLSDIPSKNDKNSAVKNTTIPIRTDDSKARLNRPQKSLSGDDIISDGIDDGSNSSAVIGFSEQSLVEQVRATATAAVVVVVTPTVQLPTLTPHQQPNRRSMGIESLRNVNEVIPRWKELHSHMRTHFYRENVDTDVLVFRETESSTTQPSSLSTTDKKNPKSFLDSIAGMRLLTGFHDKEASRQRSSHDRFLDASDIEKVKLIPKTKTPISSSASRHVFGTTLSSHLSPKKKSASSVQPIDLCTPPGLAHPDTYMNHNNHESLPKEIPLTSKFDDYRHDQPTSLAARIHIRPESFDLDNSGASSPRRNRRGHCRSLSLALDYVYHENTNQDIASNNNSKNDENKFEIDVNQFAEGIIPKSNSESRHRSPESKSISSTPKGMRASSISLMDCESTCPASPSHESSLENYIYQSYPRLPVPSSSTAPSTPENNVVPRRKESGFSTPAHLRMIKRLHHSVSDEKLANKRKGNVDQTKLEGSQQLRHQQDDACTVTPATTTYSHFEPNSIVDYSPPRDLPTAPSLKDVETRYLALPTIQQISKSENDLKKLSSKFEQHKYNKQWLNGTRPHLDSPTTPTDTSFKIAAKINNKGRADIIFEIPTSDGDSVSESGQHTEDEKSFVDDTNISHSFKLTSCLDRTLHLSSDISSVEPIQNNKLHTEVHRSMRNDLSVAKIPFVGTVEEKKECDNTISNLDLTSMHNKDVFPSFPIQPQHNILDLCPVGRKEEEVEDRHLTKSPRLMKFCDEIPSLQPLKNNFYKADNESNIPLPSINRKDTWELIQKTRIRGKESTIAATAIATVGSILTPNTNVESKECVGFNTSKSMVEHNSVADANSFDTISVCHSLPPTDANFKAAVQEVFSHLSLINPRSKLQLKDWQSDGDNKEFLSNYFYCAKTEQTNKVERAAANEIYFERLTSSPPFGDGLACAEPCNERDLPCFFFGIDTMCGKLMHFLPKDVESCTLANQRREDTDEGFPRATPRERSASFSMSKTLQDGRHSINSTIGLYQHQDEESWMGMIQRVASDRFNFQFPSTDSELEHSRHPFEPPCLSRKVLLTRTKTR
mmetsp:Transcript_25276/g.28355  ORF Transcript_25276/g.28355 Transcript_25276/m.28355 type:complete len:1287 (+) Transcript_25276:461-4321(+)